MMIAIALRCGLNPNDLKLITALFVFAALIAPGWIKALRQQFHSRETAEANDAQGI
jgi:putative ABC transport system permease protein